MSLFEKLLVGYWIEPREFLGRELNP